MPAWVALMVHVPLEIVLMVNPVTVQTPGVSDSRVTVRPDVAVAPDANDCPFVFVPGLLNVMV